MHEQASRSVADILGETTTLLCCVAFYGPPVLFFAAPWLLFALMLMGPFALVLTLLAALCAATAVVAGIAALLAAPIVLMLGRRAAHEPHRVPARAEAQPRLTARVSHSPS